MSHKSPYARPRQKSCITCAEGKRRCNRQTPQCSRCLAQGLECTYLNGSPQKHRVQPESSHILDVRPESFHVVNDILSFWPPDDSSFDDASSPSLWLSPRPSLPTDPSISPAARYPESAVLDRWSINQLLRSIKSYPRMFATSRKTPFIHHRLYDAHLPDAIQDAFTVSVAYCTKSSETEDMVFRILESKAASLAKQDHQTSTLRDLLAAVQALTLFHIIQLFDGDVRQRSVAEQKMDTLRSWTLQLQTRAAELPPALTWKDWIFAESIRRTVIYTMLVEGLYLTLKTGRCPNVRALSMLPFTSSTVLWDINTSASWLVESDLLGYKTVLYGDFVKAWQEGQITGELDKFQKLLLIPCMSEEYRDMLELDD